MVTQPCARGDHVEDLHDLGAKAPGELAVAADRVLARHPSLFVGGGAQGKISGAEEAVMCLDTVPGRKNIRQVGAHLLIDDDRTFETEHRPGLAGKLGIWSYADDDED